MTGRVYTAFDRRNTRICYIRLISESDDLAGLN